MRGSQKQGYTRYGLIFSSILFGLMHLNIQQFFYAMVLGCLMGIVVIVADSIYPAMIIHFMNNALSIYFTYGVDLNWPLAGLKSTIENIIFSSNFILSILLLSGIIFILLAIYRNLVNAISKDNHKQVAKKLAKDLKLDELDYLEMQIKIEEVGEILNQTAPQNAELLSNSGPTLKFTDEIFLYSSIVLGALITACSFIWGIL